MGEGGQIAFFLTWLTSSPSRSWAPGLPWLVALRPYKRVSLLCVSPSPGSLTLSLKRLLISPTQILLGQFMEWSVKDSETSLLEVQEDGGGTGGSRASYKTTGDRFQGRAAFRAVLLKLISQGNVPGQKKVQGALLCWAPKPLGPHEACCPSCRLENTPPRPKRHPHPRAPFSSFPGI